LICKQYRFGGSNGKTSIGSQTDPDRYRSSSFGSIQALRAVFPARTATDPGYLKVARRLCEIEILSPDSILSELHDFNRINRA
jgi:hypothetical protein